MRAFVSAEVVDIQRGIYSLYSLVRDGFGEDAFPGDLSARFDRARDRIRILVFDHDCFWLHLKRLERGTLESPAGSRALTRAARSRRNVSRASSVTVRGMGTSEVLSILQGREVAAPRADPRERDRLLAERDALLQKRDELVAKLEHQVATLTKPVFGPRSEKQPLLDLARLAARDSRAIERLHPTPGSLARLA